MEYFDTKISWNNAFWRGYRYHYSRFVQMKPKLDQPRMRCANCGKYLPKILPRECKVCNTIIDPGSDILQTTL